MGRAGCTMGRAGCTMDRAGCTMDELFFFAFVHLIASCDGARKCLYTSWGRACLCVPSVVTCLALSSVSVVASCAPRDPLHLHWCGERVVPGPR